MRGSIRLIMEVDFYLDGLDDCDGGEAKVQLSAGRRTDVANHSRVPLHISRR